MGKWKKALAKVGIALSLVLVIMFVPLPPALPPWAHYAQLSAGAILLVCLLGKILYDTLFYDHYQP